jgi:hypothetical protein
MQELRDSIKRPKLRIMGIEEEEVQAKGIFNIFNKIITENFPNLKKVFPIQVQEASRTPNRLDQNRTSQGNITIKITITENRERMLKVVRIRKKKQIMYKGKPIKITADFSMEASKARMAWHRETKANTLKATEANRKKGPGTREKVRAKRINLEGNTHAQKINVSHKINVEIAILISTSKNTCSFLLWLILSLQQN